MKILRLGDGALTPILKAARVQGHTIVSDVRSSYDAIVLAGTVKKDFTLASKALASGVAVLCATPGVSDKGLGALLDQGVASKTLVYVPHHRRVFAPFGALVQQVAEGKIGDVGFIKIHSNQVIPRGYSAGKHCGAVIGASMVQDIDWLHANFGPIRKVFCQGTQLARPKTDYAMATFTLKKGVIAQVIHSYQSKVIPSLRAEICGTAGIVQYDSADVAIRQSPARSVKEQRAQDMATTWAGHWRAFAELVDRGGFSVKEAVGYGAPARIAGWAVQSVKTSSPVVCTK